MKKIAAYAQGIIWGTGISAADATDDAASCGANANAIDTAEMSELLAAAVSADTAGNYNRFTLRGGMLVLLEVEP